MMLTPSRGNKCIIYNKKQGVYFTLIEEKNKKVSNMSDFICFGALDMSHTLHDRMPDFKSCQNKLQAFYVRLLLYPFPTHLNELI
jgi:hypothetical protein